MLSAANAASFTIHEPGMLYAKDPQNSPINHVIVTSYPCCVSRYRCIIIRLITGGGDASRGRLAGAEGPGNFYSLSFILSKEMSPRRPHLKKLLYIIFDRVQKQGARWIPARCADQPVCFWEGGASHPSGKARRPQKLLSIGKCYDYSLNNAAGR